MTLLRKTLSQRSLRVLTILGSLMAIETFAFAADENGPTKKEPYRKSKLTRDESEKTADHREILLTVGEDYTLDLDFDPNAQIVVGNPQVLMIQQATKRQMILKPLKEGETTAEFRDDEGNLKLKLVGSVAKSNLNRRAREIRELLRDVEGVTARIVGQKIVIEGEVLVPNDYGMLLNVVRDKAYADYVINQAKISQLGLQVLAKKIEDEVKVIAPNVKARLVNGKILIEGQVETEEVKKLVKDTAELYAPPVLPGVNPALGADAGVKIANAESDRFIVYRLTNAPVLEEESDQANVEPEQVRLTVHFVELSKDFSKVFGFKWQPGFTSDPSITVGAGATGGAAAGGTSFTGTISSLFPKLRSAQQAGYARILKSATVITRDGQRAIVNQSTQIPITGLGPQGNTVSLGSQNVEFNVTATPYITPGTKSVRLDLNFRNAAVVGRSLAGATTSNSTVETSVYMNAGDSAAVAAMSNTDVGTDFNKDDPQPGTFAAGSSGGGENGAGGAAVQTNPLFTLLRSKNYRKNKKQIVVFVTPEILKNPATATEDLKRNFRIRVK